MGKNEIYLEFVVGITLPESKVEKVRGRHFKKVNPFEKYYMTCLYLTDLPFDYFTVMNLYLNDVGFLKRTSAIEIKKDKAMLRVIYREIEYKVSEDFDFSEISDVDVAFEMALADFYEAISNGNTGVLEVYVRKYKDKNKDVELISLKELHAKYYDPKYLLSNLKGR